MRRLFILMIIVLFLVGCQNNISLGDKIINTFENKSEQSNSYKFSMKEITDFKWDKMVIYDEGSSVEEVSEALGFRYKDSVYLANGIVFVYKNKIVFKEEGPSDPENAGKYKYYVANKTEDPNCMVLYPNDAIFMLVRYNIDGMYYYTIVLFKNLNRYNEENRSVLSSS